MTLPRWAEIGIYLATAIALTTAAVAFERMILIQSPEAVRKACGDDPRHTWGCVTFLPAVDNPLDVLCIVHVPNTMVEIERGATINRLRGECG